MSHRDHITAKKKDRKLNEEISLTSVTTSSYKSVLAEAEDETVVYAPVRRHVLPLHLLRGGSPKTCDIFDESTRCLEPDFGAAHLVGITEAANESVISEAIGHEPVILHRHDQLHHICEMQFYYRCS